MVPPFSFHIKERCIVFAPFNILKMCACYSELNIFSIFLRDKWFIFYYMKVDRVFQQKELLFWPDARPSYLIRTATIFVHKLSFAVCSGIVFMFIQLRAKCLIFRNSYHARMYWFPNPLPGNSNGCPLIGLSCGKLCFLVLFNTVYSI